MTKKFGFGLAAIATLALAACSGSSKQDASNLSNDDVHTAGILGTFTSDCTNIPGSILALSSYNVRYEISGHMDRVTTYYSSNDCKDEVLDIRSQGEYSLHGAAPQTADVPAKTYMIDYTYKHEIITPKTQALVDAMNTTNYCGIANWSLTDQPNTPAARNVDPAAGNVLTCFGTEKLTSYYDLINAQNSQLRFGQGSLILDKTADNKRPNAVSTTVVAHK